MVISNGNMKIKRKIYSVVIFFVVMILSLGSIQAKPKEDSPYPNLEKDIELKQGTTLVIQNTNNTLFWEFEDFDDAIMKIKNLDNTIIDNIKNKNDLLELSKDNWEIYRNVFVEENEEEIVSNQKPELLRLYEFFIVCENMEANRITISIYNSDDYDLEKLSTYLPYTSPIIEKMSIAKSRLRVSSTINKTNMINYAKKYAVNNNNAYINYGGNGDCANFASQILKAGGMPNNASWSPYTRTWSAAHNFALYWYSRSYSQTSTIYYSTFLNDARSGDFIAQDFQNDGRWDHIGFIAGGSGSGLIIAQHSDNYYGTISGRPGWKNNVKRWTRIRFAA